MSLGTILLIILAIALLGGGPFYGTGYLRRRLGLILVVVLILVLLDKL